MQRIVKTTQNIPSPLANVKATKIQIARPVGVQIFDRLKTAILQLDITPGALISEAEVAELFDTSRTPVREAFIHLRAAGLITTRPSRGNFVNLLNQAKILESRFIREAIELANVEHLSARGISNDYENQLRSIVTKQNDCMNNKEPFKFQKYDDLFHLTIAKATGFSHVGELLQQEKVHLDRLRVFAIRNIPHRERIISEHIQILDSIVNRHSEQARLFMRSHLRTILPKLSALAIEHAEYFDQDTDIIQT